MVNIVSVLEMRPYIIGKHLNNDEDFKNITNEETPRVHAKCL
jgi:hypothetical protein